MRTVIQPQLKFGETDIAAIVLDPKSRDDIPQLLRGLQYIYTEIDLRQRVFAILEEVMPARADGKGKASSQTGRPGMEQWKILVLGVLRLGLNVDYDRIQELANQHKTIRQMRFAKPFRLAEHINDWTLEWKKEGERGQDDLVQCMRRCHRGFEVRRESI